MKILITGTHFTPAQALIEELQKYDPKTKLVYIGRSKTMEKQKSNSVESQILPKMGVKFYPLTSGGLKRYLSIATFISLFKIPIGFIQAFIILLKEKPSLVVSFGGYTAVPVVIDAWLLNIKIIMHEQTMVTGLSNQIISFFASKIAVSFDSPYYLYDKKKVVLTGNPLRKQLLDDSFTQISGISKFIKLAKKSKKPLIFITGGNQGSHIINQTILKILVNLTDNFFVIHQTGDSKFNDFEALNEIKNNLKHAGRYLAKKWINVEDLRLVYESTNLVISRAGANTLLELSFFKVPTIVIPIPYLHADEQNKNALFFKKLGLVQILPQAELSDHNLLKLIDTSLRDLSKLKKTAQGANSVVIEDSAKRLALESIILAKSHAQI